jgi:hypothetical protein
MALIAMATIGFIDYLVKWNKLTRVMFCSVVAGKKLDFLFSRQKSPEVHHLPKTLEQNILEYVDRKKGTLFKANNLLIAKFP